MRPPARRSASVWHRDSWCWPPGGRRSGPADGARSPRSPIGFAVAIVIALVRRFRARGEAEPDGTVPAPTDGTRWTRNRPIALAALGGGVFIVAIALLYGSTMAPSPRDGVQPAENRDEAFYAVLGRDLATTGTENNTLPSGFSDLPGSPRPDLVSLGRALARVGCDHDLRGRAARRALLRRPAGRAPRGGRPDRNTRASDLADRSRRGRTRSASRRAWSWPPSR